MLAVPERVASVDRTDAVSSTDQAPASITTAAAVLMSLSGFAGLGYQIVWTQQFGIWLGHEIVSVLAVVAAFFGGLAIGAFLLGDRIRASTRPAFWYAGCEAAIAGWGLALTWLMQPANAWLASATGPQPSVWWHWSVAFFGPLVLLLPATSAMGATLPAIERVTDRLRAQGYAIGALYAANTTGAVAGVLSSAFVLIPLLGLANTALVCVALNMLCAIAALLVFPQVARLVEPITRTTGADGKRLSILLFATGALGIGYEVVVVRVLSQVAEDTVYTFAILLAVYLLGTAAGASLYQRLFAASTDQRRLLHRLVCALAAACLIGTSTLWRSATIKLALVSALGSTFNAALAAEAAIAATAFALPTVVMGMLFSHLCVEAKAHGWSFGSAIGINTLGAAVAPLLFGVVLFPLLGPKWTLIAIVAGYLMLLPAIEWRRPRVWALALMVAGVSAISGSLAFVEVPEDGHIVSYADGVMASVSVVEDGAGIARLRINNRQQEGSNASFDADARQAYVALLLHPSPHRALFLGLGTGVTAAAAAEDRTLEVDAVELLPEVIAAAPYFASALNAGSEIPIPHVMAADARRYVRSTSEHYDVIVADLFHPARSGTGALYTVEHFAAIRARLASGGLFCQWLPVHQLDVATLRSIVHSFVSVYPGALAVLATNSLDTPVLGLIARPDAPRFDLREIRERLGTFSLPARQTRLHLADDLSLLGTFVAGPSALVRFADAAPLNTDDRPVVAHRAPYVTYAPDSLPRERLLTLLRELQPQVDELLIESTGGAQEERWRHRLVAYWSARTRFIEAGMSVEPTSDARAMLAQVRTPLLDILRISPDFAPAYDPLLSIAQALAQDDENEARALLVDLQKANPARPEAELLLHQMQRSTNAAVPLQ